MIVALMHDIVHERWHPILFRPAPLPSSDDYDAAQRYRSKGHHTVGFDTREAAVIAADEIAMQVDGVLAVDADFSWDGEGVPAMTVFFKLGEGTAVPLF